MINSDSDCDEVFEVEFIKDVRIRNGKKQYLVKWKNYPDSFNSWENENCLNGCEDKILEFLNNRSKNK